MEEILASLLAGIFAIPMAVLLIHIRDWYKNYKEMKANDRIGWWIISPAEDVLDYIRRICAKENVGTEHLTLKGDELEMAIDIIKVFQEDSKKIYLACSGFPSKRLERLRISEFFMCYFESFLSEHEVFNYFNDKQIYVVARIEKGIERCPVTEYGMVYYKLFYVARLFCEKSKKLNKNYDYWSDGIKKILDTKERIFYH